VNVTLNIVGFTLTGKAVENELSRELPPGEYRVQVDALGQVVEEPFTMVADQTTSLAAAVEGDRFVNRH
jgi:hypothetical protein